MSRQIQNSLNRKRTFYCAVLAVFAVSFIPFLCAAKNGSAASAPVISSSTMWSVRQGSSVSYQIVASNSPSNYGAAGLPPGLSVNSSTGLISGSPTSPGTSTVTLSATNAAGSASSTLALTVAAPAPASFVQTVANKTRALPSSMALPFPATTLAGDFLLVSFGYNVSASATVSDSQGNSFTRLGTQLNTAGGQYSQVFFASNIKGGPDTVSVSLSANSGYLDVYLTEYTGINPNNPIDAQASAYGSSTAASSGYATTTAAGDLILGYCLGDPVCSTPGSGFTSRSTFDGNLVEDMIAANPGSYAASATATQNWALQMVALKVSLPPVITSSTSASGTLGSPFSYQITATNSPTSYGASGLPAGLSFNASTGSISGTPTATGTSTVTLTASNSNGSGSASLTLTINFAPPVVASSSSASGVVGSTFSYQITATNSPTSYAASGLPYGLAVNTNSGLISGTPSAAGTFTVTLSATNSGGTGTASLSLTIAAAAPVISSATMWSVRQGSSVSYQIVASNSPSGYGATGLPAGLSLNSSTGLISGSPSSPGTSTVTLSASNAAGFGTATLTLTIAAPAPALFVQTIANKTRATPSSISLAFPASTLAGDLLLVTLAYDVSATASLSDSQANTFTPVASQLNASGQYGQAFYAAKIKGGADTVTVTLSANSAYLDVYLTEYSGINPASPIDAQASAAGSTASASSGNATTTLAGDLIFGYCLGNPVCSTPGTGFTARSTFDGDLVEDEIVGSPGSYAASATATQYWAIQMVALKVTQPPVITSATTATGTPGSAFSYQVTATNSPTSYGASGLPAGLSINSSTGLISGTPTATGTYTVTLTASNSAGSSSASLTLNISYAPPVITSSSSASGTVGSAFSYQITATNSPTSYAASGLPSGLSLNANSGLISGTPSAAGTLAVTLSATNSGGTGSASLTLTIAAPPPVITSSTSASGAEGSAFSYQITATNSPTSYGASGLPAGLSVNSSSGLISGTSSATGTFSVSLSASNGGGTGTASLSLTLAVAAPVISSSIMWSVRQGSSVSYQIVASNSPSNYGAAGLPPGLSVNSSTGLISGSPTSPGTSTVTLSATNAAGSASSTLALTVAAPAPASFVQTVANKTRALPSSMALPFPATTLAGDFLLVSFGYNVSASATVSDSQGNSFTRLGTQLNTAGGQYSQVFFASNIKGGPDTVSVSLSANSGYLDVYLTEYTGINPNNPIDAQASAYGSSTAASSGYATTTAAGDLILGYCLGDPVCSTPGSGFTSRSTFDGNLVEDMIAANPGSYAASASATATQNWALQMVALKVSLPPVITSSTSASGTLGSPFSYQITATNSPTSYGASGLPAGLSFNASTGSISGTPTATGTSTVTLTASNSNGSGSASLTITIVSNPPAASLSPTNLTFTSQAVGSTSGSQIITVTNTGTSTLVIAGVSITGSNANYFSETNNCGTSVASGASCPIYVTFEPGASGNFTAAVTVTDNAPGSPQSVALAGTGASSAMATVSPSSLSFGNEPGGMTSSSQSVTLNNTGSVTLNITSITFAGADPSDFVENNTCGSSIAVGGSCTIAISFTPTASGSRSASLSIADNAAGGPQSVAVSGTGTHDVVLTWMPTSSENITGYNVFRGPSSGGESTTPLNSSPMANTIFVDTNVQAGTTYYYLVTAVSSNGTTQSADSNEASATVP